MPEEIWRDRRLPETLRAELRRPLGALMSGADAFEAVRTAAKVVTVGDACTLDFLARGRVPDVFVVDFKTKRETIDELQSVLSAVSARVLTAISPAGTLTRDVWAALDEAFKSAERVRVEVLGEEDLAALAAIDLAPEGTAVLYGMPDEGVVLVWADDRSKAAARAILERMV